MTKFEELCEIEGITEDDAARIMFDSVHPGICMNCDYTTEVEPDCRTGWCENCQTNTVKSFGEFIMEGHYPKD